MSYLPTVVDATQELVTLQLDSGRCVRVTWPLIRDAMSGGLPAVRQVYTEVFLAARWFVKQRYRREHGANEGT